MLCHSDNDYWNLDSSLDILLNIFFTCYKETSENFFIIFIKQLGIVTVL